MNKKILVLTLKFKNFFVKQIIAIDLLTFVFLTIIFSALFFVNPQKLSDSMIISPLSADIAKDNALPTLKPEVMGVAKVQEVIGFLPSWSVAQNVSVDIEKLTQLIYFGLGVNENGEIIMYNDEKDPTLEWHYFNSEYLKKLRQEAKENKTKVLVAFKLFSNEKIDNLISNGISTDYFIKNVLTLLKKYELDGVNLDIEYFTDSDFPTSRFLNFFLDKFSKAIKEANPNYIVSVDVNATVVISDKAYDMVKIGEVADQIILMAYDYHMPSSARAGPVAPLYGSINSHSINESVSSLIGRVPMEKLVLGIPFYGYEWQTLNKNNKSTAVADSGALATYKRVRDLLNNRKDIERYWDEEAMSPWLIYAQNDATKQIYYEDEGSITAKMNYVRNKNLAGVAIWAIGYEGKYQELWNVIEDYGN